MIACQYGANGYVYVSTNGGSTWNIRFGGNTYQWEDSRVSRDGVHMLACDVTGTRSVASSDDSGTSFIELGLQGSAGQFSQALICGDNSLQLASGDGVAMPIYAGVNIIASTEQSVLRRQAVLYGFDTDMNLNAGTSAYIYASYDSSTALPTVGNYNTLTITQMV
jgi:hypothetical protein